MWQVGRQSGLIGGWGDRPSKLPYTGPDISVQVTGEGGVLTGGSQSIGGSQEPPPQEVVISDSEIESFILSTEEQKKKYCCVPMISIAL